MSKIRACWMSDLHLSFVRPHAKLVEFFDKVKAERPDVLLVTGDTGEAGSVFSYLGRLKDHVGVPLYYVLGNHDYYGDTIAGVRDDAKEHATWIPNSDPVQLADNVVLVGVDGWADARCGKVYDSEVRLNDWRHIHDLRDGMYNAHKRAETLRELGDKEAEALTEKLAKVPACEKLIVMTHVPPFPQACWYNGKQSEPDWLPWFTCVAVGLALVKYATEHPEQQILTICGHTHGVGTYQALPNLEVRTGGWPVGVKDYGNPIIQETFEF